MELLVATTLLISDPFTYNVLVPYVTGLGISDPLFAHVDDAHSELSHEYSHETAVPHRGEFGASRVRGDGVPNTC